MKSISIEDYIKRIYNLEGIFGFASTSQIAKSINVSDASANEMINKLYKIKFVKYTPHKGVTLTQKGKQIALKIMRRHRLWEMFLVKFLNYSWDEIHEEAEILEHATSDKLEKKLDEILNFPKFDPHGDPIPKNGKIEKLNCISLSDSPKKLKSEIIRVSDESKEILQYLKKIGLQLNSKIEIVDKISFDGSVLIKSNKKIIPISKQISNCIFLKY